MPAIKKVISDERQLFIVICIRNFGVEVRLYLSLSLCDCYDVCRSAKCARCDLIRKHKVWLIRAEPRVRALCLDKKSDLDLYRGSNDKWLKYQWQTSLPHFNQVALVTTSRHAGISPTNFKIQQQNHNFKYYMSLNRQNAKVALQILLRP